MGLETSVTHVSDLNPQFPTETDALMQGDNHIRNIKQALKNTFPNLTAPVTPTQAQINKLADVTVSAAELNMLAGLSMNIMTALTTLEQAAQNSFDTLVPVGEIKAWGAPVLPSGGVWAWCDGGELNRLEHPVLFSRYGTTWGAGNGTTTFNKPDFRGRTLVGAGQGSGLSMRALAARFGTETHQLSEHEMPHHGHGVDITTSWGGDHNHGYFQAMFYVPVYQSGSATHGYLDNPSNKHYEITTTNGGHNHRVQGGTNGAGGNGAHNNIQPSAAVHWIIRIK